MEFIAPLPFEDAIQKLGSQPIVGASFTSSEWSDVPLELRDNAFFSSRIESARVLQRAKDLLGDFIAGNRKTAENGEQMLSAGSRAAFVSQMQDFLTREGIVRSTGDIHDITSEKRLGLIFDIKTRQAQDFGYWLQGMNPAVLNEFPAMRFIRVRDVKEPRELHERFQNQVYLKTDPIWWLEINKDFGTPWGPFGWGCGHDVEDVDRDEAERLGLLKPGQNISVGPIQKFLRLNHNLQASTKTLAPELVEKLKQAFGNRIVIQGDTMRWAAPHEVPALEPIAGPARNNPVSEAFDLKVYGRLADQVNLALRAIDQVHDDGTLDILPLKDSLHPSYGFVHVDQTLSGKVARFVAIRASGPWPALTAVHEIGHVLDLKALGLGGNFASVQRGAGMAEVFSALEQTEAVAGLRAQLTKTSSVATAGHLQYLLTPWEIWARAYAQFVAEHSGASVLQVQLQAARDAEKFRQWDADDFKPVSQAIKNMFNQLGWL